MDITFKIDDPNQAQEDAITNLVYGRVKCTVVGMRRDDVVLKRGTLTFNLPMPTRFIAQVETLEAMLDGDEIVACKVARSPDDNSISITFRSVS